MILFMSFPAEMAEGTSYESSIVTYLYPLRARWSAVELPQVPQPMIRMVVEEGSVLDGMVGVDGTAVSLWMKEIHLASEGRCMLRTAELLRMDPSMWRSRKALGRKAANVGFFLDFLPSA